MNGWKLATIILSMLLVLETILLISIFGIGAGIVEMENECAYGICEDYDSYYLDDYNEICYCFNNNEDEPIITKYMG